MTIHTIVGDLRRIAALSLLAAGLAGAPAVAQTTTGPNLVTNGTFQVTGGTTSFQFGTYAGNNSLTESLPGWASVGGYANVFLPGSYQSTGPWGAFALWYPGDGSNNGFTYASPTGGNFVAIDSQTGDAPITQTITGLVTGKTYVLSFAWAGAQAAPNTGASTEAWQVSLGASTQTTSTVNVASEGFSGWMTQTFSYVATGSSEVLSFLALGPTGANVPPFALLANVSMYAAVPEPASITVLLTAIGGLMGAAGMGKRRTAA